MRVLLNLALMLAITGCAALNQADTPATLVAQNAAYSTEIAALDAQATAENAETRARVEQLSTSAAFTGGVNVQLVGTLSTVVTATPRLESSAFEQASLDNPDQVGQRLFENLGVTTQIDRNGCAVDARDRFSPYEPRLYGTWIAYNLTAGTLFRVEWVYTTNQQTMFSDSWTAPQDYDELCFWFYITPEDVTLVPGTWQARLFVDEVQMTSPLRFEIEGG